MAGNTTLFLLPVISHLHWNHVVVVTEGVYETEDKHKGSYDLFDHEILHVLITGSEALSGEWVQQVVKTGEDSWRPLHIVLMCSRPCIQLALQQASKLEREYGTQSAFGMSSRWLLIPTGGDNLLDYLHVSNVTMDNVALLDLSGNAKSAARSKQRCLSDRRVKLYTLLWRKEGRKWTCLADTNCNNIGNDNNKPKSVNIGSRVGCPDVIDKIFKNFKAHNDDIENQIFPNIRRGYNGRRFRVLIKEWGNYVASSRRNGTKVWRGLFLDLLKVVSKTLNFTYDLVEPDDVLWGTGTAKDSDVGFFGHVIRKEADLGLAPCDVVHERTLLMDFASPVIYTSYAMIYRKPEAVPDLQTLLGPLSITVLLALGAAMIQVSLLVWTMEVVSLTRHKEIGVDMRDERTKAWTMLVAMDKVILATGAALLLEPSEVTLRSRSGRVLLSSWWMFSLVMAAAYSGTLTAFLSVTKDTQLFTSLQDLVTKQHDYKWGTLNDLSLSIVLENSKESLLRDIWKGIQRFASTDPAVLSPNVTAMTEKVLTENFVLLFVQDFATEAFGGNCDISIVDAGIKQGLVTVAMPKDSSLTKPISDIIQRLHATGIMSKWTTNWFPRATCPTSSSPIVISLLHVQGALLVVPVGVGLALVALAVEMLYVRRRRKTQLRKVFVTTGPSGSN